MFKKRKKKPSELQTGCQGERFSLRLVYTEVCDQSHWSLDFPNGDFHNVQKTIGSLHSLRWSLRLKQEAHFILGVTALQIENFGGKF